ncbi:hypothetical protein LIPSTDRAFT_276440 [Lipomyces starkeyi NRRL Y-11557]|uniref:Uncharacterized protein n=1 Tax=Lipomyces starkeyi NRRL Y-11557 TaxID=675824 RepID=A0A1E3Q8D7_LIPST|nr:hypothetical protein LIPSTDRAFT_276440 [Lipomyces starkeyi NRRL Y-11557]
MVLGNTTRTEIMKTNRCRHNICLLFLIMNFYALHCNGGKIIYGKRTGLLKSAVVDEFQAERVRIMQHRNSLSESSVATGSRICVSLLSSK